MPKQLIFRNNPFYKLLYYYSKFFHRIYYRKFTVTGIENIPRNAPVLFAPNHQNALMDALAVLFASKQTVGFLARADIFKKPSIAKILNFLKIMPVFRIRDGYETLENNKEVFQNTINVLKANIPICILPEGNHLGEKRLRPLKKGIARIAFQAEMEENFKLNLQIIPVGIDYSNYFNAGSDLHVHFGKPILIKDYQILLSENQPKALNSLIAKLSDGIKNLMIHIPENHYDTIMQACDMFEPNVWNKLNLKRHSYNKLVIKQYIAQKSEEQLAQNPSILDELSDKMKGYNQKLKEHKIIDKLFQCKRFSYLALLFETLLTLILLPLHIVGMITFYLPYKVPVVIAQKAKDPIFRGSIRFGIALLLFPLYFLLLVSAILIFKPFGGFEVLAIVLLPFIGYFTFYNYKHMIKLMGKIQLFRIRMHNPQEFNLLTKMRNEIIQTIDNITKH